MDEPATELVLIRGLIYRSCNLLKFTKKNGECKHSPFIPITTKGNYNLWTSPSKIAIVNPIKISIVQATIFQQKFSTFFILFNFKIYPNIETNLVGFN